MREMKVDTTMCCPKCEGTGQVLDPRAQGAKMRELRESRKVSLTEMAEKMDYTPPYLSDLELGRRAWNTDLIRRYKAALKA